MSEPLDGPMEYRWICRLWEHFCHSSTSLEHHSDRIVAKSNGLIRTNFSNSASPKMTRETDQQDCLETIAPCTEL